MSKVNIANYVVYDLANRFNFMDHNAMENELVGVVADSWNKKHFVSGGKNIKFNHSEQIRQKFMV